jgi:hypothetical protein
MKFTGEPRINLPGATPTFDKTPVAKGRIPSVNTDFITMVSRKMPALVEPVILLTMKANAIINGVNLRTMYHHVLVIHNLVPRDNACANLPMRIAGTTLIVHGTTRYALIKDFNLQINCFAPSYTGVLMSYIIPNTTKPGILVTKSHVVLADVDDLAVLTFDIKTGDSASEPDGLISLAFEWTS